MMTEGNSSHITTKMEKDANLAYALSSQVQEGAATALLLFCILVFIIVSASYVCYKISKQPFQYQPVFGSET